MNNYIIAGIDPGTTTGIAILDLNGKIVDLFSSRNTGINEIIKRLISSGKISMIATDVNPVPGVVSKLSAIVGSPIYIPEKSIQINEKLKLTKDYNTDDSHQRDALAAALNAYNKYKNKFQKIESLGLKDDVKHMILQGISIERAINQLNSEHQKIKEPNKVQPVKSIREDIQKKNLKDQIRDLKEQLKEKENEIQDLHSRISQLRSEYFSGIKKEPKIRELSNIIESLEYKVNNLQKSLAELEKLKELWRKSAVGEILPIGAFPDVFDGLTFIKRRLKNTDHTLLDEIKIAFTDDLENEKILKERGITVESPKCLKILADCVYMSDEEYRKLQKDSIVHIEKLVEEYRTNRSK